MNMGCRHSNLVHYLKETLMFQYMGKKNNKNNKNTADVEANKEKSKEVKVAPVAPAQEEVDSIVDSASGSYSGESGSCDDDELLYCMGALFSHDDKSIAEILTEIKSSIEILAQSVKDMAQSVHEVNQSNIAIQSRLFPTDS